MAEMQKLEISITKLACFTAPFTLCTLIDYLEKVRKGEEVAAKSVVIVDI